MDLLSPCDEVWGGDTVREGRPDAEYFDDALLLPWGQTIVHNENPNWGLFDAGGKLIELASFRRFATRDLVGQRLEVDRAGIEAERWSGEDYIFAGSGFTHYGHFLLTSMARLWILDHHEERPKTKLIFHSHIDAAGFLSFPFIGELLSRAGISVETMVIPNHPVVFDRILVPGPGFEEQSVAFTAYRDFCRSLGDSFGIEPTEGRRVYLSKRQVAQGIHRFAHEPAFEAVARYYDFEVLWPEMLTVSEQIALFSGNNTIVSSTSSALHTSVLGRNEGYLSVLSPWRWINGNFKLIDGVSGNRADYLWPSGGVVMNQNTNGFGYEMVLVDNPTEVARALFERALDGHTWRKRDKGTKMSGGELDRIGTQFGTDKASGQHGYLDFYEERLTRLRDETFFMVEIGVYDGASLRTWSTFFPKAKVLGVDVNPDTKKHEQPPNSLVKIADASRLETLDAIVEEHGRPLVVLDDGSHFWHHQIETLRYFWPKILPGGMFIMEDIHTSFEVLAAGWKGHSDISTYDYLLKLNRWVVGHDMLGSELPTDGFISNYWSTIRSIEWHRHTAIIYKK